jgi:DNA invertase Pin-like site-specific DNA recombinase
MIFGYARVSTDDQETALQIDALESAGCERVFQEKISGTRSDRPELKRLLDQARKGDIVIVWKLDRLGRSVKQLIETVETLDSVGVQLKSLTENIIDTTSPSGKLIFGIFAVMAEFERDMLRQRTIAGLVAAKKRGRVGGKPRSLDAAKIKKACVMLSSGQYTKTEVAQELGVSRHTLWRSLNRVNAKTT